jgi:hypothetical protein
MQPRILRLSCIQPPLQDARLMTRIAQLRLHGFRCTAVVVILAVRAARSFIQLFLQFGRRTPLAVDLEQGALLGGAEPFLRALDRFPLLGVASGNGK